MSGAARFLFASNPATARIVADRCQVLVGIDPDANVEDNTFVHERVRVPIEAYHPDRLFDLVSLRMVAEHIETPDQAVATLARLVAPGGRIVIYTVPKWSPASIVAACTPMWFHHFAKRILWRAEERDTFPAFYRMNTRRTLRGLFEQAGLTEEVFSYLNDCRSTHRWRSLNAVELTIEGGLRRLGLRYPEACILAVYRKPAAQVMPPR
jgi:SAM-dependent methyltransferase